MSSEISIEHQIRNQKTRVVTGDVYKDARLTTESVDLCRIDSLSIMRSQVHLRYTLIVTSAINDVLYAEYSR
jgi:hypothetical protein